MQFQDGLKHRLMHSSNVSDALTYKELVMVVKVTKAEQAEKVQTVHAHVYQTLHRSPSIYTTHTHTHIHTQTTSTHSFPESPPAMSSPSIL